VTNPRGGVPPPGDEPVQAEVTLSTLGALEAFCATMRADGAEDRSVVGADITPMMLRRNAGLITRLWGYPRSTLTLTAARPDEGAPPETVSKESDAQPPPPYRWWRIPGRKRHERTLRYG
jgi:hypothetical protein